MISTLDILKAFKKLLKSEFSNHNVSIMDPPSKVPRPSFLITEVFANSTDANYFTKKVKVDIQIVCFEELNSSNKVEYDNRYELKNRLDKILCNYNIDVLDRNLKFNFSYGEADGNLTIDIKLQFNDEKVLKQEIADKMQDVFIKN